MSSARELKTVLEDSTILVNDYTSSYVKSLMPELKKTFLLYREGPSSPNVRCTSIESDDFQTNEFDITGSPLKCELSYPEIDDTIIDYKNWGREEEFHLPLAKSEACMALNCSIEYLSNKNNSIPVLALCDGKDIDKTVLLGYYIKDGWYTTLQGRVLDGQQLSNIKEIPAMLFKEYVNKYSVQEDKVDVAINSSYQLCGKRPGLTDCLDFSSGDFIGSLNIEINWNTLSFYPPIRASTSTVIMEINAGCNGSHLKNLWSELTLLHRYLDVLEKYETNEKTPQMFTVSNSVISGKMKEKLNLLLSGENETDKSYENDNDSHRHVEDVKLQEHVDNVKSRQNIDFGDMLWQLLIGCSDYVQATNCIRVVLQEIQSGWARPQIILTNSSRINKIISEVLYQKKTVPLVDDKLALQLLIDTGLEKLCRDYRHILLGANLIDIYTIQRTLCDVQTGLFDIESYRKKLTSLTQIHLCLEFTLFAQSYLNCSAKYLQSIFMHAFEEYVSKTSAVKSFIDLHEKSIQFLKVPLRTVAVESIAQGLPSSWCLTLSSESSHSKLTTTSHFSRIPILPPNIYCFDESDKHEVYHFLKLDSSSTKIA